MLKNIYNAFKQLLPIGQLLDNGFSCRDKVALYSEGTLEIGMFIVWVDS
jgi:hypothetical protein